MKRILSILLALTLLASMSALPATAAEDLTGTTVLLYTGCLRGSVDLYPLLKAAKTDYETRGAEVVLVDCGNFLQGTRYANTDRGLSVYNLMDAVGYDVANLGLAEFSYTDATTGYVYHGNFTRYYTQRMLQEGTEEIVYAKNNKTGDELVTATLPAKAPATFTAICSRYDDEKGVYSFQTCVELTTDGGLKLLFEAAQDESIAAQVQDGFLTDAEPAAQLHDHADYDLAVLLSNAEGAEAPNDELVIEAAGDSPLIGAFFIDNATGEISEQAVNLDDYDPDPALAAMVDTIKAASSPLIGMSEVVLNGADSMNRAQETNLGDLTADALRWYALANIDGWDKSLPLVAVQNGGNCDNFLYTEEITEVDLLRALPFSPMGVGVLELTGAQLLEALEAGTQGDTCAGFAQVSGLSYTVKRYEEYDAGEPYGKFYRANSVRRVQITQVGDQPFDPDARYAVVADNFLINGNDTYYVFKEAKDAGAAYVNNGPGVKTRDAVAQYVQNVLGGVIPEAVYAEPEGRITVLDVPLCPFTDVKEGAFYYDAVLWAVNAEPQVTAGTSATAFSPDKTCTRAQVVTFLWRAKGSPEPTALQSVGDGALDVPFDDISSDAYYYKAVLWAVENGITSGLDKTHFGPNAGCTRGQVVTFLWRTEGKPPVGDGALDVPFTDVSKDAFYYKAVLWAVENKITAGTSATAFSPDRTCTRGQVVTFLYRDLAE